MKEQTAMSEFRYQEGDAELFRLPSGIILRPPVPRLGREYAAKAAQGGLDLKAKGAAPAATLAAGNVCRAIYNKFNKILVSWDPLGNPTSHLYDSHNNFTATIDALGNCWSSIFLRRLILIPLSAKT